MAISPLRNPMSSPAVLDLGLGMGDDLAKQLELQEQERKKKLQQTSGDAATDPLSASMSLLG